MHLPSGTRLAGDTFTQRDAPVEEDQD